MTLPPPLPNLLKRGLPPGPLPIAAGGPGAFAQFTPRRSLVRSQYRPLGQRPFAIVKRSLGSQTGSQREQALHHGGLVFSATLGTRLDAGNLRRSLRAICRKAGIGEDWTPRELRHSFVSLVSRTR